MKLRFKFYINYVECKFCNIVIYIYRVLSFILTMWNVNPNSVTWKAFSFPRFILTMWNVNFILIFLYSIFIFRFILTMWNVNRKSTEALSGAYTSFILTMCIIISRWR